MLEPEARHIRKSTRLSPKEVQLFLRLMAEAGTSNESDYWRILLYKEARQTEAGQQFLSEHGCQ